MYEKAKNYTLNQPQLRKTLGVTLVLLGFIALITDSSDEEKGSNICKGPALARKKPQTLWVCGFFLPATLLD